MKKTMFLAFGLLLASSNTFAAITQQLTGLTSPQTTITFDEGGILPETVITDQYQSLGATFSPFLYQTPQTTTAPNFEGGNLGN